MEEKRIDFDTIECVPPAQDVNIKPGINVASAQNVNIKPGMNVTSDAEIEARIRARKQEALRKKRKARARRKFLLGFCVFVVAMIIFSFTSFFTVDLIEVRGNSYFTADEVINMAHAAPGKNLIYHPNKKSIVGYLEENPYIKKAKVSRQFPSTLVITVEERTQLGAIKYDKEYLILDDEGMLLRRTETKPKITLIEGVVVKKMTVGEKLGVEDTELLSQTLAILKKAREKDLYYVRLDMTNMYILAYIYDSLVCKGTYKQLITTMDNDRLHIVIDKLFDDNIKRGTITFSNEGYVSYLPTV